MNNQFISIGDYAINWSNVTYVNRTLNKRGGYNFTVYFTHQIESITFSPGDPEIKAILNWWQHNVTAQPDGIEEIGIA